MPTEPTADAGALTAPTLRELRAELDRIDDAMHDLLMGRAEVVGRLAQSRVKGAIAFRPGREAVILRRLLARHRGELPPSVVARVWREIVSAGAALQGRVTIAVCEAPDGSQFSAAAREHFGALAPLRVYRTPAQAIQEVSTGRAAAAVLPLPREDEPPAAAWWTALLHKDEPRISVVGKLPFWAPRPEGAPGAQALLASAVTPDPSGDDRSLLGMELPADVSRARLGTVLAAAGFAAGQLILRRDRGAAQALVDVSGFVADGDARLAAAAALGRAPVVLGAYAVPFQPAVAGGAGK